MQRLRAIGSSKVSAAYLLVVGLLLMYAAISMGAHRSSPEYHLSAHQSDVVGVRDVVSSIHSGQLGDLGVVLLMLVGPTAEVFKGSLPLFLAGVFPLATAIALFCRLRVGVVAGIAWSGAVLALSALMLTRISVSYSFAARLFMFAPAVAFNLVLLIALCRRLTRFAVLEAK